MEAPEYYMEEGCGIYAMAVARQYPNAEIYILSRAHGEAWSDSIPYEVTHVYCHVPGVGDFDVKGNRSPAQMAADFDMSTYEVKGPFTPQEFYARFMGNSDSKPLYGMKKDIKEVKLAASNKTAPITEDCWVWPDGSFFKIGRWTHDDAAMHMGFHGYHDAYAHGCIRVKVDLGIAFLETEKPMSDALSTKLENICKRIPNCPQMEAWVGDGETFEKYRWDGRQLSRYMARRVAAVADNLKSWFGNSKVVNLQGEPIKVYHVTSNDFSTFDTEPRIVPGVHTTMDSIGAWFAGNPMMAQDVYEFYKKRRPGQPQTMPCYLRIQKPLTIETRSLLEPVIQTKTTDGTQQQADEFRRLLNSEDENERLQLVKDSKKSLMGQGYDGIHILDDTRLGDAWIAFSPNQIKSAIGNNGNFSENEDSITASAKTAASAAQMEARARKYCGIATKLPSFILRNGTCLKGDSEEVGGHYAIAMDAVGYSDEEIGRLEQQGDDGTMDAALTKFMETTGAIRTLAYGSEEMGIYITNNPTSKQLEVLAEITSNYTHVEWSTENQHGVGMNELMFALEKEFGRKMGKTAAYIAYVLTNEARQLVLKNFPPKFPDVVAHHITVDYPAKKNMPLPALATIVVEGYAEAEGIEALVVSVDGSTTRPDGEIYHVTLSLDRSKGRSPKDSKEVVRAGWTPVETPFEIHTVAQKLAGATPDLGKAVKRFCASNESYALLDSLIASGTWLAGGCWILAYALCEGFGGTLYGVFAHGIPQHAVARIGNQFIDGDGASTAAQLLTRWKTVEGLPADDAYLAPVNPAEVFAADKEMVAPPEEGRKEIIAAIKNSMHKTASAKQAYFNIWVYAPGKETHSSSGRDHQVLCQEIGWNAIGLTYDKTRRGTATIVPDDKTVHIYENDYYSSWNKEKCNLPEDVYRHFKSRYPDYEVYTPDDFKTSSKTAMKPSTVKPDITLYRGEGPGTTRNGRFWSSDPDFARQFTRQGLESELLIARIPKSEIYKATNLPYGGDFDVVDAVAEIAKAKGYSAVWCNEGGSEPNSVYVFDRSKLHWVRRRMDVRHRAGIKKQAMTIGPVYHGTTYDFDDFKRNKGLRSGFLGMTLKVDVFAFFFTKSKQQAIAYAKNRQQHTKQPCRLITANLTINNLLDLTNPNWVNTPITTPPIPLHKIQKTDTAEDSPGIYEEHAEELNKSTGLLDYLVNYLLADEMTGTEWGELAIDDGRDNYDQKIREPQLEEGFRAYDLFDNKKVTDALHYLGFDGAKVPEGDDQEFGGESYCVLSSNQVKILSNVDIDRKKAASSKKVRAYHGTTKQFDTFDTPAMFHVRRKYCEDLIAGQPDGHIIEAILTINNPADLDTLHVSPSDPKFKELAKSLEERGYDGAQYKNEAWIAFEPEQIEIIRPKVAAETMEMEPEIARDEPAVEEPVPQERQVPKSTPPPVPKPQQPKPKAPPKKREPKPKPYVPPTENKAFQRWFGRSKVTDGSGNPLAVYHGTTHDFDTFQPDFGNPENFYGVGYYFTSSQTDTENYAGVGPDLTNRIDHEAENLVSEWDSNDEIDPEVEPPDWIIGGWKEMDDDQKREAFQDMDWDVKLEIARAEVKKKLVGEHGGAVMPCYLRIVKPVIVARRGGTFFNVGYDRNGDYTGKLFDAVVRTLTYTSVDPYQFWQEVAADAYDGFTAYQFEQAARRCDSMVDDDILNEGGPGPVIADIYRHMGFDGIIMENPADEFSNMRMDRGTKHLIVWQSNQIKSALGNTGKYDKKNPSITASVNPSSGLCDWLTPATKSVSSKALVADLAASGQPILAILKNKWDCRPLVGDTYIDPTFDQFGSPDIRVGKITDADYKQDYEDRTGQGWRVGDEKTAAKYTGPYAFYIEVPESTRDHFWEEPPAHDREFWAFRNRPRVLKGERVIFTMDKKPVAETVCDTVEKPGESKCEATGKYEKHWKLYWQPKDFKKYKSAAKLPTLNDLKKNYRWEQYPPYEEIQNGLYSWYLLPDGSYLGADIQHHGQMAAYALGLNPDDFDEAEIKDDTWDNILAFSRKFKAIRIGASGDSLNIDAFFRPSPAQMRELGRLARGNKKVYWSGTIGDDWSKGTFADFQRWIDKRYKVAASKEFKNWLGDVKTTSPSNARDLKVQEFKRTGEVESEPFMDGKFTIRKGTGSYRKGFSEDSPVITTGYYTVYDGTKPIASMCQGHLVVDKKYRGLGVGTTLAKEFMKDFPEYRPSSVTPKSKRVFERALTAATPEEMEQWAHGWENGAVGPESPGYAPAGSFDWKEDRAFDLHKIQGWAAGEYDFPYGEEKERDSEGETPVTYFDEMCEAIKNHTIEEIFVAEGTDEKFYVWEGNHRVGMAHVLGVGTMPAFVGYRKPTKTASSMTYDEVQQHPDFPQIETLLNQVFPHLTGERRKQKALELMEQHVNNNAALKFKNPLLAAKRKKMRGTTSANKTASNSPLVPSFEEMQDYEDDFDMEPEKYKERYNYWAGFHTKNTHFPLTVFRVIGVPSPEDIHWNDVGVCWSTLPDGAIRGSADAGVYEDTDNLYLIQAVVDSPNDVDWYETLAANMKFGDEQSEINILPGRRLRLIEVSDVDSGTGVQVPLSSVVASVVKTSGKIGGDKVLKYMMKLNHWTQDIALQVLGLDGFGSEFELKDYPLSKLKAGDDYMPSRAEQYSKIKTPFPPIVLGYEYNWGTRKQKLVIKDGNHRVAAAKMRGDKTIKAYVQVDDREDVSTYPSNRRRSPGIPVGGWKSGSLDETKVVNIPLSSLIPDEAGRDPRMIASLIEKIKRSGRIDPLEVREMGDGKFFIEDGTHRYYAAQKLGITELPAYVWWLKSASGRAWRGAQDPLGTDSKEALRLWHLEMLDRNIGEARKKLLHEHDPLEQERLAESIKTFEILKENMDKQGILTLKNALLKSAADLWHGGKIYGPVQIQAPSKGRYEAGPGLYLTTSYFRATEYAKGGKSTYLISIKDNPNWADKVEIPLAEGLDFAKRYIGGKKGKDIAADLKTNSERMNKDTFTANILINLTVNYEAGSGQKGVYLLRFLVDHGVDAALEPQGNGEQWVVVFNPKIITKVKQIPAKEVTKEMWEMPKMAAADVDFVDEITDAYSGQTNHVLRAMVNDNPVAYIEYSEYQDEPHVQYIFTYPAHLRHGYATALLKELQRMYPDTEIDLGMTTDEGGELVNSLKFNEQPSEHAEKFKQLEEKTKERDRLQAIADTYYEKDEHTEQEKQDFLALVEPLNVLNDEIWDLEQETNWKKPVKRLIASEPLPPEPGTLPIPPMTVRLYHYTKSYANLASIKAQGLLSSHGRGDGGTGPGEASAGIWASTKAPGDHHLFVEFYAGPDQISHRANYPEGKWGYDEKGTWRKAPITQADLDEWVNSGEKHVIMNGNVDPSQFLAIHEPWHHHARYLLEMSDDELQKMGLLDPAEAEKLRTKYNSPAEATALEYIQKVKGIAKMATLKATPVPDEISNDGWVTPKGLWLDCSDHDHDSMIAEFDKRFRTMGSFTDVRDAAAAAGYVRVVVWNDEEHNEAYMQFGSAAEAYRRAGAILRLLPVTLEKIGIEAGKGNYKEYTLAEAEEKFPSGSVKFSSSEIPQLDALQLQASQSDSADENTSVSTSHLPA